jgi:hypothetical protein
VRLFRLSAMTGARKRSETDLSLVSSPGSMKVKNDFGGTPSSSPDRWARSQKAKMKPGGEANLPAKHSRMMRRTLRFPEPAPPCVIWLKIARCLLILVVALWLTLVASLLIEVIRGR